MPRPCTVCKHKKLQEINAELAIETPLRDIEKKFHITRSSLSRHRRHLPVPLLKAAERLKAEEIAAATSGDPDVLSQVKDLNTRAYRLLDECETDNDRRHLIGALRESRGLLELQSRLMGQLGPSAAVQVNVGLQTITMVPEWPILMRVLDHHPEIREELTAALQEAGL